MLKKLTTIALALGVMGSLAFVSACVVPPPGAVYVRAAPPAAEVEVVGIAPGPELVWIRGYHRWTGSVYVWVPGRWERRPRTAAVWVEGRWAHHHRGWYWIEGHWD